MILSILAAALLPTLPPAKELVRPTTPVGRALSKLTDPAPGYIKPVTSTPWKTGPSLNQGNTGGCVEWAHTAFLNAEPGPRYQYRDDFAQKFNSDIRFNEGNTQDIEAGTYVFDALKWLKNRQYITSSTYSDTMVRERDLRKAVLTKGPCTVAIQWYTSFDHPVDGSRGHGLITIGGTVRGGHDILCFWADQKLQRYWLLQSWTGYAVFDKYLQIIEISFSDMRKLFNQGGSAECPTKTKVKVLK